MFRKAVMTFEGVKSDSLFDCKCGWLSAMTNAADSFLEDVPPLNLIALCIMWPISHFTSPRWFHKISERLPLCLSFTDSS